MKSNHFITYAHRGASHYCPENTMMAFYAGMQMGANGIETDVRRTRDGVLVLFHDEALTRVTGAEGGVADHTYAELQELLVKKGELHDKIPTLADFLALFAYRDITFAIELKADGIEKEVADLIFHYGMADKAVVTAFELHRLENIKAYAPALRVGYLADAVDDALVDKLVAMGAAEICPHGRDVTPENVARVRRYARLGIANVNNPIDAKEAFDIAPDVLEV